MKVFFDTNVYLRYIIPENQTSFEESERLLKLSESGKITPYVSNIVISEIVFTLNRTYKFHRKKILAFIEQIISSRNLVLIETTNTPQALDFYNKYNVKYGDSLIATQVPNGVVLCTYDPEFSKIKSLTIKNPAQIISLI